MTIRTFQPGDDVAQVSIYNEAAADLPKFKPATLDEVRRRCRAADFDPGTRFYALAGGRPVAYATCQHNGRVSFPWCRKGHDSFVEPLFERMLASMKQRGTSRVFAAYRGDWPVQHGRFFLKQGFQQTREVINYVLDLVDMPTPAARNTNGITPLTPADLPAVLELGAGVLRVTDPARLEPLLFRNPYFSPESLFALRGRGGQAVAVGLLVTQPDYALPKQLDGGMPCYRLGAFGSEGLTTKRINGMFSFLAADNPDLIPHALDLLSCATQKLESTTVETFAAQAPSDVAHLTRVYKSLFRRQGSFPVFERVL